jgi:dienelactone hydrolase
LSGGATQPEQVYLHPSTVQMRAADASSRRLAWSRAGMTDVAAWQEEARTGLARITGYGRYGGPPAILDSAELAAADGLRQTDLLLRVRDGHDIPLRVLRPEADGGGPLPVMICMQDRANGMNVSWGESNGPGDAAAVANGYDFAVQAVRRGYAAVCLELPGIGMRREPAGGRTEAENLVSALYAGCCPLADAASEISFAVNRLVLGQTGFAVDDNRIFLAGHGFGGGAAVLAVALDDRLAGIIAVDCLAQVREMLKSGPPPLEFVLPGLLHWMDMEDVSALCAPRPFLAVAGRHHPLWPVSRAVQVVEGARPVYAALGASGRIAAMPAPDAGGIDSEAVWREFERLQDLDTEPVAG